MRATRDESAVEVTAAEAPDAREDTGHPDDVDHFTCCDPTYFLATDRPVYSMCGHKLVDGESIKLDVDDTPLCTLCVSRAKQLGPGEPACERLCPRLLFG